jgi:hypothetical protein
LILIFFLTNYWPDRAGMALERLQQCFYGGVPELHHLIVWSRHGLLAVGWEGHRADPVAIALKASFHVALPRMNIVTRRFSGNSALLSSIVRMLFNVTAWGLEGFSGQTPTPLNPPASTHQNFIDFPKLVENSKNFAEYKEDSDYW